MVVLSFVILLAAAVSAVALLALGLPGTWLLLAALFAAVGVSPRAALTPGPAAALIGLCLAAELLEFVCGVFGAKRYGVSTAGVWGGAAGGFVGALAGNAALPVLGAVPGAFLGTFLGAFGVELSRGKSRAEALRLGYGAFVARMLALVVKLGMALVLACLGVYWLL